MNDQLLEDSVWMLSRARGVGLVLRVLIVVAPLLAAATTCAAGTVHTAFVIIIGVAALVCMLAPDSHAGLLVIGLIALQWLTTVDNTSSPWLVATAASVTVFHAALAAAASIPAGAAWSIAMCRRWVRRTLALIAACAGSWGALVVIDGIGPGNSAVLVTAALIVLAAAGLWATRTPST